MFNLLIRLWLIRAEENIPDHCILIVTETIYEDNSFSRSVECEIVGDQILPFANLPLDLEKSLEKNDIKSNEDILRLKDAEIIDRSIYIPLGASIDLLPPSDGSEGPNLIPRPFMEFPSIDVTSESAGRDAIGFRPLDTMGGSNDSNENRTVKGNKKVLALWVKAADAETPLPMDDGTSNSLASKLFGVSGDAINFKSQFSACSAGQLQFQPANGPSRKGPSVSNGVYSIEIDSSVKGANRHDIVAEIEEVATSKLGNLSAQYDHVIFCLPSGTKTNSGQNDWAAYGYVNHWKTVYNGLACKYMSAPMHEIGHNLNLGHSNLADGRYLDKSCMVSLTSRYIQC